MIRMNQNNFKYNIWCEVKKENILLVALGILFCILPFYLNRKFDFSILILTILLTLYLLKSIIKYFSLRKNGIIINNIPYEMKKIKGDEKVLVVYYQSNDKGLIRCFKRKRSWGNVKDVGNTTLLINPAKTRQYYIFDPK